MGEEEKTENIVEYVLRVKISKNGRGRVEMQSTADSFQHLCMAAAYLMWQIAEESEATEEKVHRILCEQAQTFSGTTLQVVPKKRKNDEGGEE